MGCCLTQLLYRSSMLEHVKSKLLYVLDLTDKNVALALLMIAV
jgi:hypothetical protein